MTVQTSTNVAGFVGNGVTTSFPIAFKFNSSADLIVEATNTVTGVTTTLSLNSDYTVTGAGDENGGTIAFTAAPLSTETVKVTRHVDLLQLTDLRNQGKFYAEVHEDVFDKLVMIDQQQQTEINDANAKSNEAVATADLANEKSDQAVAKADQNLIDLQAQYDAFEQGASLVVIGDYAAGLVVDAYNKVFRKDGELYRAKAETTLPYQLNGDWAVDGPKFVSAGDAVLRQALARGDGAALVGYGSSTLANIMRDDLGVVVSTIAELKALASGNHRQAFVLGYYAASDGGGGVYSADLSDTTSVDDGGSVIIANDGTRWKLLVRDGVSIRAFGATGVDSDMQDAAIDNFLSYIIRTQVRGYVPAGRYRHSGRVDIDLVNAPGTGAIKLRGDGAYQSMLIASATTGTSFYIHETGAVNPDGQRVHTYGLLQDIGFLSDTTGNTFVLGGDDLIDCAGNYEFRNVYVANVNSSAAPAGSLKLNYVFDSTFSNVVVVGNVGFGDALNCKQAHFNTFIGGSYSNAANGIVFNGVNHNNTFLSPDMENIGVGVLNVTKFDQNNILINPFFDIHNPVTGVSNGFAVRSLAAGSGGLILDSPYTQQRAGNYLVDPAAQVELFIRGTTREQVATPAFPASDVAVTNNTGRNILVRFSNLAGTLSAVFINGEETPFTGGTVLLLPRQTIAPRYTGVAPVWRWNAVV